MAYETLLFAREDAFAVITLVSAAASTDCRYISIGELVTAGLFFFLSMVAALSARPR